MLKKKQIQLDALQEQINALSRIYEKLQAEVTELSTTFEVLKTTVSEKKRVKEVQQKQKWLNGYPDETGKQV